MKFVKKLILLFTVFAVVMLAGCGKRQKRDDEVVDYFKNIDSYNCSTVIKVINDRQTNEYNCKLYYSEKKGSRIEIGDERVIILKDGKEYVKDKVSGRSYIETEDFDKVYNMSLINEYIKLIYVNEETKYYVKEENGKVYQLIELYIPENNRNMVKAVLYVDAKELVPDKILVYDNNDEVTIEYKYSDFTANKELSDELFAVQ